jgi:hypothetical protein
MAHRVISRQRCNLVATGGIPDIKRAMAEADERGTARPRIECDRVSRRSLDPY